MTVGGLTAADMAELRAVNELFMVDFCDIVHIGVGTINPDGSSEPGVTTTLRVNCYFDDRGGSREALIAALLTQEMDALIFVPLGTVVSSADTVTYKGDNYIIVDTNDTESYATACVLTVKLQGAHV